MYLQGKWHGLGVRPEFENDHPVDGLDASLLNLVLDPMLDMKNCHERAYRIDLGGMPRPGRTRAS